MISAADILGGKILIVDDQEANIILLTRMLQGDGYTCVSSTMEPKKVRELHLLHGYDLIVLDLQMPGMDGFQVMESLKEIETAGYLPVLAVTAQPDHKVRALKAGAKDFISQPFDLAEVSVRVYNMVEVRLLHERARMHHKRLEAMALHDALTGLANRLLLTDRVSLTIVHARRHKSSMALIYLDLDGFKKINDTLGHSVGDALLRMVAERLRGAVREEDTVARVGGDEFIIALWYVSSSKDAATVTSKVLALVSQPYVIEGQTCQITASAGIALYPAHGKDVDTLIKSADTAMYEAKAAGKNIFRSSKGNAPHKLP